MWAFFNKKEDFSKIRNYFLFQHLFYSFIYRLVCSEAFEQDCFNQLKAVKILLGNKLILNCSWSPVLFILVIVVHSEELIILDLIPQLTWEIWREKILTLKNMSLKALIIINKGRIYGWVIASESAKELYK